MPLTFGALVCAGVMTIAAAQTFRTGVNLVILPVTVTDPDGRFVGALSPGDFSVFEDDRERPIAQFSAERVPVSLGILIDISGSMAGVRFADAQVALSKLIDRLQDDDRVFLSVFNETFRLILPWTGDRAALMRSLSAVAPRGGTSLYQAVSTALPILNAGPNQKKALVIISDGDDNSRPGGIVNRDALERAVQQARASDAVIYVVGIGRPKPPLEELLQELQIRRRGSRWRTTRRSISISCVNSPIRREATRSSWPRPGISPRPSFTSRTT